MWMYVCGDNDRTYYLREMALERGHSITCPRDAQVVVLPLPHSHVTRALGETLHRGQILICGLQDEALLHEAKTHGWKLISVYEDEKYQQENALDSAEGAVYALMREAPFALKEKKCLVIGWGRLAKALKKYMEGLDVQVSVAARDPVKLQTAGKNSMDIASALDRISEYDLIVNTAPAQIIGRSALENIRKGALLMDTASAPYGFNLEEARSLRVHAWRENGIPGLYCPKTAARRLMDCIERRCVI